MFLDCVIVRRTISIRLPPSIVAKNIFLTSISGLVRFQFIEQPLERFGFHIAVHGTLMLDPGGPHPHPGIVLPIKGAVALAFECLDVIHVLFSAAFTERIGYSIRRHRGTVVIGDLDAAPFAFGGAMRTAEYFPDSHQFAFSDVCVLLIPADFELFVKGDDVAHDQFAISTFPRRKSVRIRFAF
jgi:hypothetical protein